MEPIRKLIKQAAKGIDQHSSDFAKEMKLTRAQMATIDFLGKQPGQMAKQRVIEEEFAIKRSTTTIMLQRMEKRGLVSRLPDPADKRQKLVKLTDEAKDLLPGIQEEIKDDVLELLDHFSQADLDTVRRFLKYIAEKG
ncbi:MarR family winged helix-turn-helix transcriptional regulator [Lactobacillus delbrueckii]|uniref:MarR family winged helix-turn-helix transcriptional regulator n=1 Tax=Lactobacillus delbrueckii TaxID=1584 RepID=UPI0039969C82